MERGEFDACVLDGEVPVDFGETGASVVLPNADAGGHFIERRDALGEALGGQYAKFDLGDVKPAAGFGGGVDFEALCQMAGFSGREGFVERADGVGVEVVITRRIFLRLGKPRRGVP